MDPIELEHDFTRLPKEPGSASAVGHAKPDGFRRSPAGPLASSGGAVSLEQERRPRRWAP